MRSREVLLEKEEESILVAFQLFFICLHSLCVLNFTIWMEILALSKIKRRSTLVSLFKHTIYICKNTEYDLLLFLVLLFNILHFLEIHFREPQKNE